MYQRILVPLDGSALAEQALPHAVTLVERFEAELVLLKVFPPVEEPPGMWSPAVKEARKKARSLTHRYLEHVIARVQEQDVPVQLVIEEGYPHILITRYAEDNQIDLIVMCTRGRSGIGRWLMGSVADRVSRGARVPVLLVPAKADIDTSYHTVCAQKYGTNRTENESPFVRHRLTMLQPIRNTLRSLRPRRSTKCLWPFLITCEPSETSQT